MGIEVTQLDRAPLASPSFTGAPTAPTASVNNNSTQLATTGFVTTGIANGSIPTATQYGAKGDGVTDDTAAINSFLTAISGKAGAFLPGTYMCNSLVIPAFTIIYGYGATLKKNANSQMIDLGNRCEIHGLKIDGNALNFTGKGITITSGDKQKLLDVDVINMQDYCLTINKDVGVTFQWIKGDVSRVNTTDVGILLGANGAPQESNGDRLFSGLTCLGGHWLIDVQYSQTTIVSNCDFVNMQCRPTSSKLLLSGNRIATLGNNFVLDGVQASMTGNVVAGTIELSGTTLQASVSGNTIVGGILIDAGASSCSIGANSILSGQQITDNSGATNNAISLGASNSGNNGYGTAGQVMTSNGNGNLPSFQLEATTFSYAPVWSSSGTAPVLGNGTLTGTYRKIGNMVVVNINGTFGTTTTFGTGNYFWTLPFATTVTYLVVGSCEAKIGTTFYTGSSYLANTTTVGGVSSGQLGVWGQLFPATWSSGDNFTITLTYWLT